MSVWYVMGAFVWFPVIFLLGNWPGFGGVESAAVNWFYAHNALGLWLTAVNVGAAYYFIPKVLGRPIYSYQLSLLGFWALAFFYALNGIHHLIGGPLPTRMITTSIVAIVRPGLVARSVSGGLLTLGHVAFAWHCWRMVRGRVPARETPPFHEPRPIVYAAAGAGGGR